MNKWIIFTDGSINPRSKVGYGACLITNSPSTALKSDVRIKRFEETSSTQLELETFLWAITLLPESVKSITIYTDSQNIIGLPGRRSRLEAANYTSGNQTRLRMADLYQEFFKATDAFECRFVKVKGHKRATEKNEEDHLFTLVDRASRHALRQNT